MSGRIARAFWLSALLFGAALGVETLGQERSLPAEGASSSAEPAHTTAEDVLDLRISEIMASNGHTAADGDGEYHDWVEIHNGGSRSVELTGFFLSDDEDDLRAWRFPEVQLPPGERLVIWASGKDGVDGGGELHTTFRISRDGEPIVLTAPDGATIIDAFPAVSMPQDVSYGRQGGTEGSFCYFSLPTPGTPNPAHCYARPPEDGDAPPPPMFSHEPGFYTEPFELSIVSPDPEAVVLYTLDGSEPRMESLDGSVGYVASLFFPGASDSARSHFMPKLTKVYEAPVRVEERSYTPAGDDEPEISQIITTYRTDSVRWEAPRNRIFRGSGIRARTYKDGAYSDVVTASFFVLPPGRSPYTIPVISTVTDPEGLFDFRNGIHVPGRGYFAAGSSELDYRRTHASNYSQRGRSAERPAHVEVFNAGSGDLAGAQALGLRVHGGGSRTRPLKGLRLYARNAYDDENTIRHDFFADLELPFTPARPQARRLLLRQGGDSWNLTDDLVAHDLFLHTHVDAQRGNPALHFINGEFWSLVNVRDRIDHHFFAAKYGVDADSVTILREVAGLANDTNLERGPAAEIEHFNELVRYAASHDLSKQEHFEVVAGALDLASFIDYHIHFIFLANLDWEGEKHFRFWRVRHDDETYSRWRVAIWDFDGAFGTNIELDMLQLALTPSGSVDYQERDFRGRPERSVLMRSLLRNESFERAFINRFADLINTLYRTEHVMEVYNSRLAAIAPYLPKQVSRWESQFSGLQTRRRYQWMEAVLPSFLSRWMTPSELDRIGMGPQRIRFIQARPDVQRQHIVEWFRLDGMYKIELEADPNHGHVRINSIDLHERTAGVTAGAWTGTYFRGMPIRITAVPERGHRFVRWETAEAVDAHSESLVLDPDSDIRLRAVFAAAD